MKPIILVGIILSVLGVVALAYHGITYTTHEKVLKIGPIEATKETEKIIPSPLFWEEPRLRPGLS